MSAAILMASLCVISDLRRSLERGRSPERGTLYGSETIAMTYPVAIFSHPDCAQHDTGPGHPECADRLAAVMRGLERVAFHVSFDWREAPEASDDDLLRVHTPAHLDRVRSAVPATGLAWLDPDTAVGPASLRAARRAAGAVVGAVDAVLDGEVKRAFCAVRPPGHHAERQRPMGFCLFNSVACGAARAVARGIERVAIVDFDVHHGNGTEDAFREDPRVLFCSSFQHPFYPMAPLARRTHLVHVPLGEGADGATFRHGVERRWWPALEAFAPELILVSAGFDAHRDDPMAGLVLGDDDYRWITEGIVRIADRFAQGRVVSVLEGGYDLQALVRLTAIHVEALSGIRYAPE
jgi:acetoin utilization deacetylase AcuC-like enzyme